MIHIGLYNIAINIYVFLVWITSFKKLKAKQFIEGRVQLRQRINQALQSAHNQRIWVHCASLGEYEQALPVLQSLRNQYPQYIVILTFFSPSGYEVRKDTACAHYTFYLPTDNAQNAQWFLEEVRPTLAVFVKYDLWYHYLSTLHAKGIPIVLISAIFQKRQGYFKWYGVIQRKMLHMCSHIFVQDAASEQLLRQIGIQNTSVVGDTRFDRVIAASEKTQSLDIVVDFIKKPNILVAGSTWWPDETMLQALSQQLDESWQMIIVPHEVDRQHIDKLSELFGKEATTYSNYSLKGPYSKILVVDTIGKLIHIYRYATVVWVGGGFGKAGIHNVLEPAVFAKPCFFGPIYHQFIEANALIVANAAKEMHDFGQFYNFLSQSYAQSALEEMGKNAHAYVVSKGGATSHIMAYLAAKLDN